MKMRSLVSDLVFEGLSVEDARALIYFLNRFAFCLDCARLAECQLILEYQRIVWCPDRIPSKPNKMVILARAREIGGDINDWWLGYGAWRTGCLCKGP